MKKLGKKITKILKVSSENFKIKLKFSDGFTGELSLGHIFSEPKALAAEVMKGNLFSKCFIEAGALAWPNGLEFCPDSIRMWIKSQSEEDAA